MKPLASYSLSALALAATFAAAPLFAQDDAPAVAPSRVAGYALSNDRQSAADYVRDILVLVNLGEGQLAKPLMDELAGMQLSGAEQAALVARFGTAKIHRLARANELGPQAAEFVAAVMSAAGEGARSTEQLAKLVNQIKSGDKQARRGALSGLQAAGADGAVALTSALAATNNPDEQNRLREAVTRLAPLANPVVAAALDSSNDSVRVQAAWALGQMNDRASLPRLAAIAAGPQHDQPLGKAARWAVGRLTRAEFTPASAEPLLRSAIYNTAQGVPARPAGAAGQTDVWTWDNQQQTPTVVTLSREQAAQVRAARLAGDLWRLNQSDPSSTVLALAYRLQGEWLLASHQAAADLPGPQAADAPSNQLQQALQLAMEENLTGAAIGAADAIGSRRDPSALASPDGKPTTLASALTSADAGVRFAALRAIMAINPRTPFPGSSRVSDALVYFASSDGQRGAVVAMPKHEDAATLSGQLAANDIQGFVTNQGAKVARLAAEQTDVELVMLDMSLLRPAVREVLFRLRRQPQTARLPVALLAREGQLDRAKQLAREHDLVVAYPRPHTPEATLSIADAVGRLAPAGAATAEQRLARAKEAAGWIQTLLAEGPTFYNLRGHADGLLAAVNRTAEVDATLPSLALVGTPDSQQQLANIASRAALPIATRTAAADAFRQSVQQHGLLLKRRQILDQYDRYNASEQSDEATQRVLGAVLDTIESLRNQGT